MSDRFIFLDIDGVLNSEEYFVKRRNLKENRLSNFLANDLDEEKVELLNKLIDNTKSSIILSSSWREYGLSQVNEALKLKGFEHNIEFHTTLKHMDRGEQILEFINRYDINNYIVIDDETCDIENYIPLDKIIKTSWKSGIQEHHVENIIKQLNKQNHSCSKDELL